MAILGTPPKTTPPSNKRLIAGLIKGNQWLIHPDHKADYFLGGVARIPMVWGMKPQNYNFGAPEVSVGVESCKG